MICNNIAAKITADATGGAATGGGGTGGEGMLSGATGATGAVGPATEYDGQRDTALTDDDEPEPSASADTIGRCAFDVEQHVRVIRRKGLRHKSRSNLSKGASIWPIVSLWAQNFCQAEAEAAKSRAALVGRKVNADVASACAYASQIFMETAPGGELDAAVKFCKTLRQFTGKPLSGVTYNRHTDHSLLPKAPITLRHELTLPTRVYTFGPAPIESHHARSDMESFATPEEVRITARKHFGPGNMDIISAAEAAHLAAREGSKLPKTTMALRLENSFAKKWKAAAVESGVVFGHIDEPVVAEPNRQLKVPVPSHRVVNQTTTEKLDRFPMQNSGRLTGDYAAGGASSLLVGNRTK